MIATGPVVIGILWVSQVLRAPTSLVFLLAAWLGVVYAAGLIRELARNGSRAVAVRKSVLLLVVIGTPLVMDTRSVDAFNLPKATFVVVASLVAGVTLLVQRVSGEGLRSFRNPLTIPVLLLAAVAVAATAFGAEPRVSLWGTASSYDGLIPELAFLALFVLVGEAVTATDLAVFLRGAYLVGAGLVTLYGLIQLHDVLLGGQWDWLAGTGPRAFNGTSIWSSLGNPDHLGSYLAMMIPVAVGLLSLPGGAARQWFVRILLGVQLLELLVVGARGAWLGAIAALAATAYFRWTGPRLARRRTVIVSALASLVIIGATAGSQRLRTRITTAFQLHSVGSTSERLYIWRGTAHAILHRPVLGVGPDALPDVFQTYQSRSYAQIYGPQQDVNGAHNLILSYTASMGVGGTVLFVWTVASALRLAGSFLRRHRRAGSDPTVFPLAVGLFGAIVAYLVQAMVNVQQVALSTLFWGFLGLLVAVAGAEDGRYQQTFNPLAVWRRQALAMPVAGGTRSRSTPVPGWRKPSRWIGTAIGIGLTGMLSFEASRPYLANLSYGESLKASADLGHAGLKSDQVAQLQAESGAALLAAVRGYPWDPLIAHDLAHSLAAAIARDSIGSLQQEVDINRALAAFRREVSLQPRSGRTQADFGQFLLGLAELNGPTSRAFAAEAVNTLEAAHRLDPFDSDIDRLLRRARTQAGLRP